jgi:hypothetical protein
MRICPRCRNLLKPGKIDNRDSRIIEYVCTTDKCSDY